MSRRSVPALVAFVVALAAIVVVGRDRPVETTPVFSEEPPPWMPSVAPPGALTGTWFCPGVPATGEDGVGGEVVVANRDASELTGRFTVLGEDGVVVERALTVAPWSRSTIDVDAFVAADFASVVVELDGGRGTVEQRALHPAGTSVSACSNETSEEWYLADGFTLDGSVQTLILTNPFDEAAVADLRFATVAGESEPNLFQGFTIAPRSVRTIRIGELARDEPVIATAIETTFGPLVVGRAQHYLGGGRLGYDVSLASPALRDQFWFADGERGPGISETYSIYNPTDEDIEVDVLFLGLPIEANFGGFDGDPIEVPSREVVVFDPYAAADDPADDPADGDDQGDADDPGAGDADGDEPFVDFQTGSIPDGRHAAVFSTLGEPAFVVERVLTRPVGESVGTSVLLGAPPRVDGFVASRWLLGVGPDEPTEDALVVYNVNQIDATVTVSSVGPAGPTVIPSLSELPLGPGAVITIDLTDPDAVGKELIVESTSRIFVERVLPTGARGATGNSWPLPDAG